MSADHKVFGGNGESAMKQGRFIASGDYDALIEHNWRRKFATILDSNRWDEQASSEPVFICGGNN